MRTTTDPDFVRLRAAAVRYLNATTARMPVYSWKYRDVALAQVHERHHAENELRAALAATATEPEESSR